jgi:excisionase family DNA binding protein
LGIDDSLLFSGKYPEHTRMKLRSMEMDRVERLIGLPEAAERSQTTVAFWRKVVQRRGIPVVKIGRLTRIRVEDFERFLRDGYRPAAK